MSERASPGSPRACSGDRHGALPMTRPLRVMDSAPAARAIPKSTTFTRLSRVSITLPGFTSRCTTPLSCAAASARLTSVEISTARSGGSAVSRRRMSPRVSPSTISVTM